MNESITIGAVSYLNTKPLVHGLDGFGDVRLVFDLPSRLAVRLADGELDVALIPVIEAAHHPEYSIVSDACIACRGPVRSVKLYSRVAPDQIRSLGLDEGSRTSAALARIILKRKHNIDPTLARLPIDQPWRDLKSDAVLVIGDRAMADSGSKDANSGKAESPPVQWDLGELWNRWTELPFVFAVWAARPGVDHARAGELLASARDNGLENIDQICRASAAVYDMSTSQCTEYLTRHLHFYLGQRERMGLNLFLDYARQQNLIPIDSELRFHDCSVAG